MASEPEMKDKEVVEEDLPQEVRECLERTLGVRVDDRLAEALGDNWKALINKAV